MFHSFRRAGDGGHTLKTPLRHLKGNRKGRQEGTNGPHYTFQWLIKTHVAYVALSRSWSTGLLISGSWVSAPQWMLKKKNSRNANVFKVLILKESQQAQYFNNGLSIKVILTIEQKFMTDRSFQMTSERTHCSMLLRNVKWSYHLQSSAAWLGKSAVPHKYDTSQLLPRQYISGSLRH